MLGRRFGLGLALVFAVGGGLVPVVARAGDPATEQTFLTGLERARGLLKAGKAAEGLKVTKELLTQHEGRDYVCGKRADLEDLVKRLSFGVRCPPPAPRDVVKGRLVAYTSNPTRLKIVYDPKNNDLENDEGVLTFPTRFAGPYSIQIRGSSYPRKAEDSPRVLVGMEENAKTQRSTSWQIIFGTPPYDEGGSQAWMPAKLVRYDGDEKETLAEKEITPAKPGAPFKIDVDVGAGRITASINGKSIGQCAKPTTVFGYLAFECRGWEEATIEGVVEPSFIQGKIDELVQESLAVFEKGFEIRTVLPEWLYTDAPAGESAEPSPEGADEAWPVEIPRTHWRAVAEIVKQLDGEHFPDALDRVASLRRADAPEVLCLYLAAQARYGQGDYTAALADLDRTVELAPAFRGGLLLRAVVLGKVGREADAEAAFRAAVAASPADAEVVESAAMSMLLAGRSDAARALLEDAARRGLRGKSLEALARVLVKVTRGPDWTKSFEYKSTNYHVFSDIDAETCRQAGSVLEEALAAFKLNLQGLSRDGSRQFRVFLFRGQAGFGKYMEDVSLFWGGRNENAAGVYSPVLKQLLIWNLPSREEMMRTVRHEGFHQYLDRLLPDAPSWFNEGLATYYENMGTVSGQKYGSVQRDLLRTLDEKHMIPLAEFLHQSPKEFYLQAERTYAQAWLVVHMLRHGTPAQKELFKDLLTRLKTQPPFEALRAVFPPDVVERLEPQLELYAQSLESAK